MLLPLLITPSNLRNALRGSQQQFDKFRVIEANVGEDFRAHYNNGHIDRAIYLDTMHCTQPTKLNPRNLPDKSCFQDYVGSLGISNKHHLILYDRSPFGFYASSRMWWIFNLFGHDKISILNGGLRGWISHNYELSAQLPDFKPESFVINEQRKELIRNYQDMKQNELDSNELVIDARGSDEFGRVNSSNGRPNHIPNSLNVPYNDLFDQPSGTLKNKEQLLDVFKQQGVDLNKNLVASCMTGMTACTLALASEIVNGRKVPVYYGSWIEYAQKDMQ